MRHATPRPRSTICNPRPCLFPSSNESAEIRLCCIKDGQRMVEPTDVVGGAVCSTPNSFNGLLSFDCWCSGTTYVEGDKYLLSHLIPLSNNKSKNRALNNVPINQKPTLLNAHPTLFHIWCLIFLETGLTLFHPNPYWMVSLNFALGGGARADKGAWQAVQTNSHSAVRRFDRNWKRDRERRKKESKGGRERGRKISFLSGFIEGNINIFIRCLEKRCHRVNKDNFNLCSVKTVIIGNEIYKSILLSTCLKVEVKIDPNLP